MATDSEMLQARQVDATGDSAVAYDPFDLG